jgi:hypothetical protein
MDFPITPPREVRYLIRLYTKVRRGRALTKTQLQLLSDTASLVGKIHSIISSRDKVLRTRAPQVFHRRRYVRRRFASAKRAVPHGLPRKGLARPLGRRYDRYQGGDTFLRRSNHRLPPGHRKPRKHLRCSTWPGIQRLVCEGVWRRHRFSLISCCIW